MCGSPMRIDAELIEGQRRYHWYKCTNLNCGQIFLVQERASREVPLAARSQGAQANSAAV